MEIYHLQPAGELDLGKPVGDLTLYSSGKTFAQTYDKDCHAHVDQLYADLGARFASLVPGDQPEELQQAVEFLSGEATRLGYGARATRP